MKILLKNISKRFGNSWVFKDANYVFEFGRSYAITGANGSGKSTFLKIISGGLVPSGGQLIFSDSNGQELHWSDAATRMSFSAPYIELIERLTLQEQYHFHFKFRKAVIGMDQLSFMQAIDMEKQRHKQIRDFSSGMKQRLKLAFCFYTQGPVILLDEPTSNLDKEWSEWYREEIQKRKGDHLIIIASNDPEEYTFCDEEVRIENLGIINNQFSSKISS